MKILSDIQNWLIRTIVGKKKTVIINAYLEGGLTVYRNDHLILHNIFNNNTLTGDQSSVKAFCEKHSVEELRN
jgi:hypothetical protein